MAQVRRLCSRFVPMVSLLLLLLLSLSNINAQTNPSPELRDKIDKLATDVLGRSGVPSVSIAVVKEGNRKRIRMPMRRNRPPTERAVVES